MDRRERPDRGGGPRRPGLQSQVSDPVTPSTFATLPPRVLRSTLTRRDLSCGFDRTAQEDPRCRSRRWPARGPRAFVGYVSRLRVPDTAGLAGSAGGRAGVAGASDPERIQSGRRAVQGIAPRAGADGDQGAVSGTTSRRAIAGRSPSRFHSSMPLPMERCSPVCSARRTDFRKASRFLPEGTHLVFGRQDRLSKPSDFKGISRRVSLTTVAGAAHFAFAEQPQVFQRLFLEAFG